VLVGEAVVMDFVGAGDSVTDCGVMSSVVGGAVVVTGWPQPARATIKTKTVVTRNLDLWLMDDSPE